MRVRVHWFIQALAFATLSLNGIFLGGQLGGVVAGAFGCCAFLSMNDWRIPAVMPVLRGVWWRLFDDPRLGKRRS